MNTRTTNVSIKPVWHILRKERNELLPRLVQTRNKICTNASGNEKIKLFFLFIFSRQKNSSSHRCRHDNNNNKLIIQKILKKRASRAIDRLCTLSGALFATYTSGPLCKYIAGSSSPSNLLRRIKNDPHLCVLSCQKKFTKKISEQRNNSATMASCVKRVSFQNKGIFSSRKKERMRTDASDASTIIVVWAKECEFGNSFGVILMMGILSSTTYRVCHGLRLTKRDDYFRVNFDHL